MKLIVDRDILGSSVAFVTRMLPIRPPSPILSGLLIEAKDEGVTLSTFDYETSARVKFGANVTEEGTVLIPGILLGNISQKLPDKPVEINEEDGKLVITCGPANYSFSLMPINEYPPLPTLEGGVEHKMQSDEFVKTVSQVVTSTAKDDVNAVITGVNIRFSDNSIEMTGTDRYRVATKISTWQPKGKPGVSAIVSSRILSEVSKTLGNLEKEISIFFIKSTGEAELIGFESGNKTVTSLVIAGNYPPVEKLFREETDHYAVLKTDDIFESTKRVSLVVERDEPIEFSFTPGEVTISGSGVATASERVECELFGEDISVMLRPQFLCDGLSACGEDFVKISFTQPTAPNRPGPVLITPKLPDKETPNFKYLLQPNLFAR